MTTTGFINEQSLEKQLQKQMGCMTGLLQLFDRHHLLTANRLPPPAGVADVSPESEKCPTISQEQSRPQPSTSLTAPSPDWVRSPMQSPTPLPLFEVNGGGSYSWKFSRETARLSLDSRATFDAAKESLYYAKQIPSNSGNDDTNRRSTSVIAKLMGLEPIQNSDSNVNKPEQKSSASNNIVKSNVIRERNVCQSKSPRGHSKLPKNQLDSGDKFPEPKQMVSFYGEIDRRLRMRGINEPCKDLETLKQILEAMQLKGLLHSRQTHSQIRHKNNIVYDPSSSFSFKDQSPIVVVKPLTRRMGNASPPPSNVRPQSGVVIDRNMKSPIRGRYSSSSSPTRSDNSPKISNSHVKTQRRINESINSRKVCSTRNVPPDHPSLRRKYEVSVIREDESSSSLSPSQTDKDRCNRTEEYKQGRSLLERCDKLLNSIAQMNATELQPSPVSVLDSSFYKDHSCSPSPVMKRRGLSFTDESVELEEELLSCPDEWKNEEDDSGSGFIYISQILRASTHYSKEADIFLLLEKQQCLKGKDTSKVSRLHRKLIFDAVTEILDRDKQTPSWKAFLCNKSRNATPTIRQIRTEFQRIREREKSEDLFGIVCGVLKKDLSADTFDGWGDCPVEMSEAVLDIERLIFKDLVGESIRHLAEFARKYRFVAPRRKLVF